MRLAGIGSPARQRAHRRALAFAVDHEDGFARLAEPMRAQAHALGRRLGRGEDRQHARTVRVAARVVAREEAAGVAVFAQAEEHEVEFADGSERQRVLPRRLHGPELGRDRVYLRRRNRYMVEPGRRGHAGIALGVVGRRTALVAEEDLPRRPVGRRFAQQLVDTARRSAAGEDEGRSSRARQWHACPRRQCGRPRSRAAPPDRACGASGAVAGRKCRAWKWPVGVDRSYKGWRAVAASFALGQARWDFSYAAVPARPLHPGCQRV